MPKANPLEEAVPKVKGMPITNTMDYRPPRKAPIAEESAAVARKLQVRGQTEAFEQYLQAQRANSEPLTSRRTSAATGCYGGTMPPVGSSATTRSGCALGSFERPRPERRQDVRLREVEDDALNGDYLQHPVLVTQGNKILGPISIFIWGCQILGRRILFDLIVEDIPKNRLHLMDTPMAQWIHLLEVSWIDFISHKCKSAKKCPDSRASLRTWRSLWGVKKSLPSLSLKFRTFGLLTGAGTAKCRNRDSNTCEFCGSSEAGQAHVVLNCTSFEHIRSKLEFARCHTAPILTRLTGIPTCSEVLPPANPCAFPDLPLDFCISLQMGPPTPLNSRRYADPPGLLYFQVPTLVISKKGQVVLSLATYMIYAEPKPTLFMRPSLPVRDVTYVVTAVVLYLLSYTYYDMAGTVSSGDPIQT